MQRLRAYPARIRRESTHAVDKCSRPVRTALSMSSATKTRIGSRWSLVDGPGPSVIGKNHVGTAALGCTAGRSPADKRPSIVGQPSSVNDCRPTTNGQGRRANDRSTSIFFSPCPARADWRKSGCVYGLQENFFPRPEYPFRSPRRGRRGQPVFLACRRPVPPHL
jgi:hypothetical protein